MPVPRAKRTQHGFTFACRDNPDRLNGTLVYAAYDGQYVKIGRTDVHPTQRLAGLQTGNPRQLTLLAYTGTLTESRAHKLLFSENVRGEWFKPSAKVLAELRSWDWNNR